jgi:undecaprenyl-diphosphatase
VLSVGRVAIGVHFPSDVLAGAVLGCVVALLLYYGPVRSRIDRLADLLGGWLEAFVGRARAIGTGARG